MTFADLDLVADVIAAAMQKTLDPVTKRLDALEARELSVEYAGVYTENKRHKARQLTTRGGSLWLCLRDTTGRPGDSDSWKLIVKRGEA